MVTIVFLMHFILEIRNPGQLMILRGVNFKYKKFQIIRSVRRMDVDVVVGVVVVVVQHVEDIQWHVRFVVGLVVELG